MEYPGGVELSDAADVTLVIDRTALVENILNQVIESFCEPSERASLFFWEVLLDSSIMQMGSKSKIAMAIAQQLHFKLDQDAIHSVMSLRNAFAHHDISSHPVLVVRAPPEVSKFHFELQIISNSGKVSRKRRDVALSEFNASFQLAKESLVALLDAIKAARAVDTPNKN